jgi:predicted dehydrogenase
VSSPDDHHPAAIRGALAAGVAVFCEKPLANTAAEAQELAELAERSSALSAIGFSFRYSHAAQQMRSDLHAGALGTAWLVELHEHNPQFHPTAGRALNWKGNPAHAAGGAIYEYGAHVIDLGCWLLGPVTGVSALFATVVPGAVLDDIAILQMRYASGALGTLVTSWVLAGGYPGIRVRIHGSHGGADCCIGPAINGLETYRRWTASGDVVTFVDLTPKAAEKWVYVRRALGDVIAVLSGFPQQYPDTLATLCSAADVQGVLQTALSATWLNPVGPAPSGCVARTQLAGVS